MKKMLILLVTFVFITGLSSCKKQDPPSGDGTGDTEYTQTVEVKASGVTSHDAKINFQLDEIEKVSGPIERWSGAIELEGSNIKGVAKFHLDKDTILNQRLNIILPEGEKKLTLNLECVLEDGSIVKYSGKVHVILNKNKLQINIKLKKIEDYSGGTETEEPNNPGDNETGTNTSEDGSNSSGSDESDTGDNNNSTGSETGDSGGASGTDSGDTGSGSESGDSGSDTGDNSGSGDEGSGSGGTGNVVVTGNLNTYILVNLINQNMGYLITGATFTLTLNSQIIKQVTITQSADKVFIPVQAGTIAEISTPYQFTITHPNYETVQGTMKVASGQMEIDGVLKTDFYQYVNFSRYMLYKGNDTTSPVIHNISFPQSVSSSTTNFSIVVTASDNVFVGDSRYFVEVNGNQARSISSELANPQVRNNIYKYTYEVQNDWLVAGENTINVTFKDAAGNTSIRSITITKN